MCKNRLVAKAQRDQGLTLKRKETIHTTCSQVCLIEFMIIKLDKVCLLSVLDCFHNVSTIRNSERIGVDCKFTDQRMIEYNRIIGSGIQIGTGRLGSQSSAFVLIRPYPDTNRRN